MQQDESKLFSFLCPGCQRLAPVLSKNGYTWRCQHREIEVIEQGEHRRVKFLGSDDRKKARPDFDNTQRYYKRVT